MSGSNTVFVIGGVALKKGRIRNSQKAMVAFTKEINPYLIEAGFLDSAPFKLINAVIRYGDSFSEVVEIGSVDKRHQELPIAIEVALDDLKLKSVEEVKNCYAAMFIGGLLHVADEFGLPKDGILSYCKDNGFSLGTEGELETIGEINIAS